MCVSFNKQMCIQLVTQLVGSSRLLTFTFQEQLYRPNKHKHIVSLHNTSRSCVAERHRTRADTGLSPPAMDLCLFVAALLHSVSSVCCHVAVCVCVCDSLFNSSFSLQVLPPLSHILQPFKIHWFPLVFFPPMFQIIKLILVSYKQI